MSITELEKAVAQLPPKELVQFSKWFEEFVSTQWDKQFESDVASGKLERLGRKADKDFESGRCTPL
jgi:hypothetical protein